MAEPRITYNNKNVDFPTGALKGTFVVDPVVPKTVNTTMAGSSETITEPRLDVRVSARWKLNDDDIRSALENWWQYAQRGNSWTFAYDANKTVSTTLSSGASQGDGSVVVTSATGILNGQQYVILDGAIYQLITVEGISGTTISFAGTLDSAISNGATFRDRYFFNGELRGRIGNPFQDEFIKGNDRQKPFYGFALDFFEASAAATASGVIHVYNEILTGSDPSLASTPVAGTERLYYIASGSGAGVRWKSGDQYSISGAAITATLLTGDEIVADYDT